MTALIFLALDLLAALVKSKSRREAENAALRQQLIVLQRKVRGRVQFNNGDRLVSTRAIAWDLETVPDLAGFAAVTFNCVG